MSKLDDLCTIKVMGWQPQGDGYAVTDDKDCLTIISWHPSTSLDDALVCLERAAKGEDWDLAHDAKEGYNCSIYIGPGDSGWQKTLALAMCLCSLRAMGVPESEISIAMEAK